MKLTRTIKKIMKIKNLIVECILKRMILILLVLESCSSSQFVDRKISYIDWQMLPNNMKYLEIEMIDAKTTKRINDRKYYLSFYGCNNSIGEKALVEIYLKTGLMNKFPLPFNQQSVDLIGGEIFPYPSVLDKRLTVSTEFNEGLGIYTFTCYKIKGDLIVFQKKVVIDFEQKKGILTDTTKLGPRIWY